MNKVGRIVRFYPAKADSDLQEKLVKEKFFTAKVRAEYADGSADLSVYTSGETLTKKAVSNEQSDEQYFEEVPEREK